MTVSIPAYDAQGTALQGAINNITTLITNNPLNIGLGNQLYLAQQALCQYLMANGNLSPVSILANETYIGAP